MSIFISLPFSYYTTPAPRCQADLHIRRVNPLIRRLGAIYKITDSWYNLCVYYQIKIRSKLWYVSQYAMILQRMCPR